MVDVNVLSEKKKRSEKIAGITAYDFFTASIVSQSNFDFVLIGDSLNMVVKGEETTITATMDNIIYHSAIVSKTLKGTNKIVVADMPFLSYQISVEKAIENCGKVMVHGGVHAVKIEGGELRCPTIKALVSNGIPVMGHIGLTPQMIYTFGGYKVKGKTEDEKDLLAKEAIAIEDAGVFAIVIECVREETAKYISSKVSIPVIGIGSGIYTDGQILVINDVLGMSAPNQKSPKFARKYTDFFALGVESLKCFSSDIKDGKYPSKEEAY